MTERPHPRRRPAHFVEIVAGILLLVPAVQPLLTATFTCGYDNAFHLWRAVQVEHLLRQSILFSRWAPDMAHGFGLPLFTFHAPASAYIAAFFHLAGLPWSLALNATFLLGMALGGLFIYILARDIFGPYTGAVTAVAYVFAPFQAYDAFNRGSLSEAFAWAFPPLVLWALHRWLADEDPRFLALGSLSLAALILTHHLFAFLFSPLLLAWVLLESHLAHNKQDSQQGRYPPNQDSTAEHAENAEKSKKTSARSANSAVNPPLANIRPRVAIMLRGVLLGLLALGLSAFFWLPGLAERGWVQTGRLLGTWVFDYSNNFLDAKQLLALPRPVDVTLINDWPPKALGLVPVLVALLPLARWHRLDRAARWRIGLLLVSAVGFALLTLPISRLLWDHLPLLPYVQFPWRFLGPAALCCALLAGATFATDQPANRPTNQLTTILFPAVLILTLALSSLGWFYPDRCMPPSDTSAAGMIAWERATHTLGTTAKGEYLPIWVQRFPTAPSLDGNYATDTPIVRLPPEALPASARVINAEYGPLNATIELESPSAFQARYLAFYYPGWRVWIDGQPTQVAPSVPEGFLTFDVPPGRHTIRVRYGETPTRLVADAISLASLVGLLILTLRHPGTKRRPDSPTRSRQRLLAKSPHIHWSIFVAAALLFTIKSLVIDRVSTPLRDANLKEGGRLKHVDVPAEVTFGDEFVLLGYDTLPRHVSSGAWFEVKTYWRALHPGGPDYGVTVNLVDADGYRWSGLDVRPPRWHRTPPPVGEWPPEKYALVALSIPILPGTPPGTYTVELVAFDQDTLAPLTAHDAQGQAIGPALRLDTLDITPPRRPAALDELGMRQRLDASLGPLTLLGADLDRDQATPGDPALLVVFWKTEARPADNLTLHLALLDSGGSAVFERDLAPSTPWHPTSTWRQGDVWRGQHLLHLPATLESGSYTWRITLLPNNQWLDLPTTIQVTAPSREFTPPPFEHAVGTPLGDVVTLAGFGLSADAIQPGKTLTATLVWRAETETRASYHVFLHLLAPDGTLIAQSDGIPAVWTRPTTGWVSGEYIVDVHTLSIPPDAPAGDYTLSAGLYLPGGSRGGSRLTTPDGRDAISLITVAVRTP